MKSSLWTPYISDHTIHAICWTLIHSLWIGMTIALVAGLVITATRKSGAALRYNLLCGVLMLFTLSVWVTFFVEMQTPSIDQGPFRVGQFIRTPDNHIMIIPATTTPHLSLFSRVVWLLNEYSNIIFLVWLLLFVLKSLKMAGGLLYIQRIRNYKVHEVSEDFKHKIDLFAGQIGIRQAVHLVQSELVKVPVAVGWLKPMILLPMGILLQLSPEQLESILWHELAHIRRRDYLVNILQGLVETIFFFNPGLLWLSSLIRAEREACCDDMVLSRMNRKANYLEALLAFGSEDNSRMPLAMSIGSGNELRDRLKRMIDNENKRLNMAEKVVLVAGLVVLSAFTTMPKTTIRAAQNLVNVMIKKPGHRAASKTIALNSLKSQPLVSQKTMLVVIDTAHGKIDTPVRFKSVLFKHSDADLANNDISAMDEKGIKYHFIVADNKLVAMDIDGEKVSRSDLPKYEYILKLIDDDVRAKRSFREQEGAYAKLRVERFKADRRFDDKHRDIDSMTSAYMKVMNDIIADMVVHNVVSKAADVKWFALTDTELIVNGQKQPDELQLRYKAKYGIHEGLGLYYGPVPMQGKGVFIDPEGMSKARHLSDSIRSEQSKVRLGTDDERRALKLQMMIQRLHDDSANYASQKDRALNVIADLVHDKAVRDPASVKWFGLSNTEFLVNGQKQSDEMQQRYKAKYGIYKDYGLYYGPVQMHGTGVFIDVTDSRPPLPPRPRKDKAPNGSGYVQPRYVDTNDWKIQQLIKQRQAFAADYGKAQKQLVKEQRQTFAADQAKKQAEIKRWQQHYSSEQELKIQQTALQQLKWRYKGPRIPLQDIMANITEDLVNANVLKNKSDLVKFNLTNSALMVNGIKQPDDLHEKLKAKYLEKQDYKINSDIAAKPYFGLHFNAQNGAMGLGITDGPDSP
jgi:bla regulator protein blaR1